MTAQEFIKHANAQRLANKHKWVFIDVVLDDGRDVQYKAYNTYIQIYKINGMDHTHGMAETATAFKETLNGIVK